MRSYELMVIHRPEMSEVDVQTAVVEVETAIAADGEVDGRDSWGKRRFAYEIDHITEGHYSVITFKSDGELIGRLDRALGLQDRVIRHKIVRLSEQRPGKIKKVSQARVITKPQVIEESE